MKQIRTFIVIIVLQCIAFGYASSQLLFPMQPETSILPSPAQIMRPVQTFAYSFEDVGFYGSPQNLYLSTWSQGAFSGFHWRRATTLSPSPFNEMTTDEGIVQITGSAPTIPPMFSTVQDVSAVLIQDNSGTTFIIVTFYGVETSGLAGHYMQLYRWYPWGVNYDSTIPLSSSSDYGRISLDAHKLYAAVIVWERGSELYMKGILNTGGGLNIGPSVAVPSFHRGFIPDIAFGHPTSSSAPNYLLARVVYASLPNLYPTVFHLDFNELMTIPTPSYITDDINFDAFPGMPTYIGGGSSMFLYPHGENLKIDCPDHAIDDDWAYIYTTDQSVVKVRGSQYSNPPATVVLTSASPDLAAGFNNQQLAIHFNRNGRIYTGWRSNYGAFAPGQRYVGKVFNFSGLPTAYSVISNHSFAASSIAFSKQDDLANCLFASYLYFDPATPPSGYDLLYKLKEFSTGVVFSESKQLDQTLSVGVSPNPFSESIRIDYQGDPARQFAVSVTNSVGQVILSAEGDMAALQSAVDMKAGGWAAGYYIFRFQETAGDYSETIKVVKQ